MSQPALRHSRLAPLAIALGCSAALSACAPADAPRLGVASLSSCEIVTPVPGTALTAAADVDPSRADIQLDVTVAVRGAAGGESLEVLVDGVAATASHAVAPGSSVERFSGVGLPKGPTSVALGCRIAGKPSVGQAFAVGESCGLRFANLRDGQRIAKSDTHPGAAGRAVYTALLESTGVIDGASVEIALGDFDYATFGARGSIIGGRAAFEVPASAGAATLHARVLGAGCRPTSQVSFTVEAGTCAVSLATPPRFNAAADRSPAPGFQSRLCLATDCDPGSAATLQIAGGAALVGTVANGQACFDVSLPEGGQSIVASVAGAATAGVAPAVRTCVDVTPPIVALTSPVSGLRLGALDDASPSASGFQLGVIGTVAGLRSPGCDVTDGRARVELRVNGAVQSRFVKLTDGVVERVVDLAPGENRVELCAYDALDNFACAAPAVVTVDLGVPALGIASPRPGALIGADGKGRASFVVEVEAQRLEPGRVVRLARDGGGFSCDAPLVADGARVVARFGIGSSCAALADGAHSLFATATDSLRNVAVSPRIDVTIDSRPPALMLLAPELASPSEPLYLARETVPVVVRSDLPQGAAAELFVGEARYDATADTAGQLSFPNVTLFEGVNTLAAHARDRAGNETWLTFVIVRDLRAPEPRIADLEAGRVYGVEDAIPGPGGEAFSRRVTVSVPNEEDGVLVRLRVVGGATSTVALSGGVAVFPRFVLAEGANHVEATVTDRAGNVGSTSVDVAVRTQAPRVSLVAPVDGRVYNAADRRDADGAVVVPVSVRVDDSPAPSVCELRIDAGTPAERSVALDVVGWTCQGEVGLGDGAHTLTAFVTAQSKGNSLPIGVRVDTRAPVLSLVAGAESVLNASAPDVDARAGFQTDFVLAADGVEPGLLAILHVTSEPGGIATSYAARFDASGRAAFRGITLGDVSRNALTFDARDAAGNPAPTLTHHVVVDREPPTARITSPGAGVLLGVANDESPAPGFQKTVSIVYSGLEVGRTVALVITGDAGEARTYVSAPVTASSGVVTFHAADFPAVTQERATLTARVSDVAGNGTEDVLELGVDLSVGTLAFVSPIAAGGAALFCGAAADVDPSTPGTQIEVQLAATGFATGSRVVVRDGIGLKIGEGVVESGASRIVVTLPEGDSALLAQAFEASGNSASTELVATRVDTIGPQIVGITCDGDRNGDGLYAHAEDGDYSTTGLFEMSCQVSFADDGAAGQPVELWSSFGGGTRVGVGTVVDNSAIFPVALPGGASLVSHTLTARSRDACGNASTGPVALSATVDLRPLVVTASHGAHGQIQGVAPDAAIACGAACSAAYPYATQLRLRALPDAHYRVAGWSGCDAVDGADCLVRVEASRGVQASFAAILFPVSLAVTGPGSVSLGAPFAATCASSCSYAVQEGTHLTLTATPATHWQFAGWVGACEGQGAACAIDLAGAASSTAVFTPINFAVAASVSGNGSIQIGAPVAATCSGTCSYDVQEGTALTLSASAASGWQFASWSGACAGQGATCALDVAAASASTATFTRITFGLGVVTSGSGSVILGAPVSATCGASCSYTVNSGDSVTLTASPASGWQFASWSGACAGQGATCSLTISAATSVGVSFTALGTGLSVSFTGQGSVASTTPGIDCGATCSASFTSGANVRLVATPASSQWIVTAWTGCTSSSGNTCDVTMDQTRSVTVTFDPAPAAWLDACALPGMTRHFDVYTDDAATPAIPLPFTINVHGTPFSSVYVTTNAILGFDAGPNQWTNGALPSGILQYGLFAFWDDLTTSAGNGICVGSTGAVGAQKFVVTWSKMGFYAAQDATALTFSAILDEATGGIEVVYYDMSSPQSGRGFGSSATIGLEAGGYVDQRGMNQSIVQNGTVLTFQ